MLLKQQSDETQPWYQHKGTVTIVLLFLLLILLFLTACDSLKQAGPPIPIANNAASSLMRTPSSTPTATPTETVPIIYTQNIRGPHAPPAVQSTPTQSSTSHAPGSYTSTRHVTASSSDSVAKSTISTDVTTAVSCGSADCFDQHFSNCTPATMAADANGVGAILDTIIGPASGGCSVTFMYTQNPNPVWVNQPMTCTFDNQIDFKTSFYNTFDAVVQGEQTNCSGPLVAILRPAAVSSSTNQ
jgi:hypothetical protein